MTLPNTEFLSAAACAMRIGLTVRALRVYENQGLIKPERSPAGWRRYGSRELQRLNQIALLKVLGLTLSQIKELLIRPTAPSLEQLLKMQLDSWRERRRQAARGEVVTEAALQHLQSGGPLSVEELYGLIRSIDMKTMAVDDDVMTTAEVPPAQGVLDRFVGCYLRKPALGAPFISREGDVLVLHSPGRGALMLEQTGEADFALSHQDLVLSFEQVEDGIARQLVVWFPGMSIRLQRTNEAAARAANEVLAERVRAGRPMAGSADMLRRLLDGIRVGEPDYAGMSPEFADLVGDHLLPWQILGQYFGPVVSMEFIRVSPSGWDVFQVRHENDVQRYRIALGDDGKVIGFTEASATAEQRTVV
jgi:DNA-binding transcriptional MerR regulator